MGLFKSLRGKLDVGTDAPITDQPDQGQSLDQQQQEHAGQFTPPSGPPPSRVHHQPNSGHDNGDSDFNPPSGPPSSRIHGQGQEASYLPPPGPPPSYQKPDSSPRKPSSSSVSQSPNPPPYHDWTIIPDTSLLPPPPPLPQDYSPTNNASYDSAARAHEWCARHPVYTPVRPSHGLHLLAQNGHLTFEKPPPQVLAAGNRGFVLQQLSPSAWTVRTSTSQQDVIVLSSIPLYFAAVDHPGFTGRQKTIYFEIVIKSIGNANSGIAIGFSAKPYPPWRLPGWHRSSIGVHGDDGRRFVNDSWGGRDFVPAFRRGETVGLGMTFTAQVADPERGTVKTTAFLTRNGQRDKSWEWDIDEERDERDEGVEGLMGEGDLYPSIGMFGGVQFGVIFGDGLTWRPRD